MARYRDLEMFQKGFQDFGQGISGAVSNYIQDRQRKEQEARQIAAMRNYADRVQQGVSENAARFGVANPTPTMSVDELIDTGADPGQIMSFYRGWGEQNQPKVERKTLPSGEYVEEAQFGGKFQQTPVMGADGLPIRKPESDPSDQDMKLELAKQDEGYLSGRLTLAQAWKKVEKELLEAASGARAEGALPAEVARDARRDRRELEKDLMNVESKLAGVEETERQLASQLRDVEASPSFFYNGKPNPYHDAYDTWVSLKRKLGEVAGDKATLQSQHKRLKSSTKGK